MPLTDFDTALESHRVAYAADLSVQRGTHRAAVGTRVAVMPRVLALMAHPDDIEITCAGTLILLKAAGWDVHLATMTAGDLGSSTLPRGRSPAFAARRRPRRRALLGAGYTCLGIPDLTIAHTERHKRIVTGLLRAVRPDRADHASARRLHGGPRADVVPGARRRLRVDHPQLEGAAADRCARRRRRRRARRCRRCCLPTRSTSRRRWESRGPAATSWTSRRCSSRRPRCWRRTPRSARGCTAARRGRVPALDASGRRRPRARLRKKSVTHAEGFVPYLGHAFPKRDPLMQALGTRLVTRIEDHP